MITIHWQTDYTHGAVAVADVSSPQQIEASVRRDVERVTGRIGADFRWWKLDIPRASGLSRAKR